MADNTLLNLGTGGDTIASDDIAGVKFQRVKLIHGADGVNGGDVSTSNGLPTALYDSANTGINSLSAGTGANGLMTAQGATNFFVSTANSSTTQLAASATFNGTIESVLSAPYCSIILDCDQPGIITVKQYITSSSTTQVINTTFTTAAKASGVCFGRSFAINGNYISVSFQNTGASTTTTLNLNVAYGNIDATTQLLNTPVALNEVNGAALNFGQSTMSGSLPVALASNQSQIPVSLPGVVSTVNSSTTNLGISGVFTGTSEDISGYATITVSVFSDVASATDGLQMQQSTNGTNWDNVDSYTIPAATGKTFKADIGSRYFRLVYTNGGTAQTAFRLQTIYSLTGQMGSSIRPQDGRSIQNDVRETMAYLGGFNGTSLDMLRSTIANGLQVDVTRNAALVAGSATIGGVKLIDTAGTNVGTIKAASTAVAAGDTALAVGLHPSSPLPAGTNTLGGIKLIDTAGTNTGTIKAASTASVATDTSLVVALSPNSPVAQATLTKGTQGTTGVTVQALNDAGRNPVHFYTVIPVLTSATDTLQSLTGTKSGATVTATTTPAVVTTGKTFRVTRLAATYVATATSGYGVVRMRFNTGGVVAITSPVAATLTIGAGTPATANSVGAEEAAIGEGWEFAAGTGVGISVQGFAAVTATAVGYITVSMTGYEY